MANYYSADVTDVKQKIETSKQNALINKGNQGKNGCIIILVMLILLIIVGYFVYCYIKGKYFGYI